ncbi:MAG: DNA mismatch repair endonuclease MutL [Oscillospiraceae bacterium]|nr:DNA mismatch repair endonuclease MutL [Oscillospiraceae bacterium]
MPKIIQLSPHIANLIAAGEVVERPASVVKELLENAVDAGASQVTVEIKDGGMTFLRVTDNGCGMSPEDARTAFARHATSKLRTAEDLAAIGTMGFRGEALAAIASVSRIDLLTKTPGAVSGVSLRLEGGSFLEEGEAGCPDGTTIIIRDLFFNTPARMKFMKSDTVEGSRVAAAVQQQALAHPETAFRFIRDGKQVLQTPGSGQLQDALYCVYGRECAKMVMVDSRWDQYSVCGYVTKPTDARPSRSMQTFFVNNRPVKSRLLISALEEAYRNQIMAGKFPGCVLHLTVPHGAVDVNVHPAKTEVKFLNEKAVFDCIHYGILAALNKQPDRPQIQLDKKPPLEGHPRVASLAPSGQFTSRCPEGAEGCKPKISSPLPNLKGEPKPFFRTMTAEEFKTFSAALQDAPQPKKEAAAAAAAKIPQPSPLPLKENTRLPGQPETLIPVPPKKTIVGDELSIVPKPSTPVGDDAHIVPKTGTPVGDDAHIVPQTDTPTGEPEQIALEMPPEQPWRMVGELFSSYIAVEQGDAVFLIDKHAAHERILFEKLKANQEAISAQTLLSPLPVRLSPAACGELLSNRDMLEELGFEIDEFGDNTVLLRQIPMDLSPELAADALENLAADLLKGRREKKDTVRDELLHTVACKAAIKAGWKNDEAELMAVARQVMEREDLKYCPHGRPICITLTKKQLEKQFKRT